MDKKKENIETMFDEIAPTYDRLNHLFTLNLDVRWRKEIVNHLKRINFETKNILDLASGTGDLTKELLNLSADKIFAADISKKMLDIQEKKINDDRLTLVHTDGLILPFENNYFDLVTIGFGVRNFENLVDSLCEIRRVLNEKGKLVILEMFKSNDFKAKLFNVYFGSLMPFIGNKISKSSYAYNYLFNSVESFYGVEDFLKLCNGVGFELENSANNFLGIVNTIYLKKKK